MTRKRETRRTTVAGRVVARDIDMLRFVAACQPVVTSEVAGYVEASVPVVRRRVRLLFDMGLVKIVVTELDAENHVLLSEQGRRLLVEEHGADDDATRARRGIGGLHLDHHHAGVRFYVALAVAARRSGTRLVEYLHEDELRRRAGALKGVNVPDAAFVVARGAASVAVAVEIDRATENPAYVVRTKAAPYAQLRRRAVPLLGVTPFVVAVAVPHERRRNRLAAAFHGADVDQGLAYFIVDRDVVARSILVDGWTTVRTSPEGTPSLVTECPFFAPMPTGRVDRRHAGDDDNRKNDAGLGDGQEPA